MNKLSKYLYYGFIGTAIVLSFIFYKSLSIFFIILGVTFDIAKPIVLHQGFKNKNKIYLGLAFILIIFSLIASMGNFMNFTAIETKQVITDEYNNNTKAIESQKNIVSQLEKSFNKLNIKDYTSNMNEYHTTNITKVTNEFIKVKKEMQESIKKENDKLITLQNKKIKKYKTIEIDSNQGYHNLFNNISEQINIDKDKILLGFSFLFAIILETLIIIFTHINCENQNEKEITPEDIMNEALKENSLKQAKYIVDNLKNEKRLVDLNNESSNEKDQIKDQVQVQIEKINQSNVEDQVQIQKIKKVDVEVEDKVREVACENENQSLKFESKDQIKSSTNVQSSTKDQKRSSSKQKIGFQSSSSDKRSNKIGFNNQEPMIVKIVKFLKDENMQGKQFPTAKVSDHLKCKRYEIDQLKPKLIEEKIIYKCNSKSYRVADFI